MVAANTAPAWAAATQAAAGEAATACSRRRARAGWAGPQGLCSTQKACRAACSSDSASTHPVSHTLMSSQVVNRVCMKVGYKGLSMQNDPTYMHLKIKVSDMFLVSDSRFSGAWACVGAWPWQAVDHQHVL